MGANPKQALGLALFFIGWVAFAAGMADEGMIWLVAGLALVAGGAAVLIKAKPLEHMDS